MESPDEKKWLKRRKWKDRTKAEKNNGDNNKGDAHALLCTVLESIIEKWGKKDLAKTTPKKEKTRTVL